LVWRLQARFRTLKLVNSETSAATPPRKRGQQGTHRPGDLLRLALGEIANRGAAVARTNAGQVVFVHYGAPGEEVIAQVDRVHKDRIEAHVVEVLTPSSDRVQPLCPYFGACGGCTYQHLSYERQLAVKRAIVVEALQRIGGFTDVPVPETVASPSPWFYRNQARFSTNRWGEVGFTRRMSNEVMRIDTCFIMEPAIRDLLPVLQGKGAGLHQIVVRTGVASGDLLIEPNLSGRGVAAPSGQLLLTEIVAGRPFGISASAFFQVNTPQAERMVELVAERLCLTDADVLADLYAGVGFFSKILAPRCRTVLAIEISRQAAENAAYNLADLPNVQYLQGAVEQLLSDLPETPTKMLLDPSREGCAPAAIDAMLAAAPERIVYVSCDAATLARDLRRLVDGGYAVQEVQPLDMFPQTFHVECIATLLRR